jgi:hypothetical protein
VNILRGIFEIATGRARGLERFGSSPRDFLVSLYVLMSVPAISALVVMFRHGVSSGVAILLLLVSALLAPAVISHFVARLWGRDALWLRFATAFNWSRFAIVSVFALMLAMTAALIGLGVSSDSAAELMVMVVSFYSLWLEWFIARNALRLPGWRAVLLVLAMNIGTFLLLALPGALLRALSGDSPAG